MRFVVSPGLSKQEGEAGGKGTENFGRRGGEGGC